jgi:site-specific recombinase XerD
LDGGEFEALMAALYRPRPGQGLKPCCSANCGAGELRLEDLRLGVWRVLIREGKGGHQRLVPVSPTFFAGVAAYMNTEPPSHAPTDRLFVQAASKGPTSYGKRFVRRKVYRTTNGINQRALREMRL